MSTFIRPVIKTRECAPKVFTSVFQGGAYVSEWVNLVRPHVVATGTTGVVGEICTKMQRGIPAYTPKPFIPPYDYKFYAEKMIPVDQRADYIKKCEKWFEDHPPKVRKEKTPRPEYDEDSLAKFWNKRTTMPPIEERVKAMEKAGLPQNLIEKHIAWDEKMNESSEDRQQALNDIFGKFIKLKPKPKVKAKVIKPVKKKMG